MIRRSFIPTATVALGAVLLAPPAAGQAPGEWDRTPAEGPAGTTIVVEGACVDDVNEWSAVTVILDSGPDGEELVSASTETPPEAPWALELIVPEGTEPGDYQVGKQCHRLDDEGEFDGGETTEHLPFTVTESEPEPEPTDPPPAAPVADATPTFTG